MPSLVTCQHSTANADNHTFHFTHQLINEWANTVIQVCCRLNRCVYEWNYFSFVVYCSVCTVLCDSWLLKHIINEEFKFIPMTLHKYYDFRDGVYLFLHLTVQFFFHTTTPYSLPMLLPHTIYPMFPSHTFRTLHMPSIPFNSSKRGIVGAVSSAKRRRG